MPPASRLFRQLLHTWYVDIWPFRKMSKSYIARGSKNPFNTYSEKTGVLYHGPTVPVSGSLLEHKDGFVSLKEFKQWTGDKPGIMWSLGLPDGGWDDLWWIEVEATDSGGEIRLFPVLDKEHTAPEVERYSFSGIGHQHVPMSIGGGGMKFDVSRPIDARGPWPGPGARTSRITEELERHPHGPVATMVIGIYGGYCQVNGLQMPSTNGEVIRAILEEIKRGGLVARLAEEVMKSMS